MKAIERYTSVMLFITLNKVVLTLKVQSATIQLKAIKHYFFVVLFIKLYKVLLTF